MIEESQRAQGHGHGHGHSYWRGWRWNLPAPSLKLFQVHHHSPWRLESDKPMLSCCSFLPLPSFGQVTQDLCVSASSFVKWDNRSLDSLLWAQNTTCKSLSTLAALRSSSCLLSLLLLLLSFVSKCSHQDDSCRRQHGVVARNAELSN